MRALHNPRRHRTPPTHRPSPLDFPTQLRLGPPRHGHIQRRDALRRHTTRRTLLHLESRPGRTVLSFDFRKPLLPPRPAHAELLSQCRNGVRLSRVPGATRLHPRRLPQVRPLPPLQSRPGHTTLVLDFQELGPPPVLAPPELLPQRGSRVGLTGVPSATRLRTRLRSQPLPLLLMHNRPSRTALIPDLREPHPAPPPALPELPPQRLTAIRLTCIPCTTRLRQRRLVQQRHTLWLLRRIERRVTRLH